MVIDLMRYRGAMRVAKVAQQPALLSRRDTFVSAVCQGGWGGLPCPRLYVVHQTGLIASRGVVDFGSGVVHALRSTSRVER
ncbi:hypothetical protein EXE63_02210 (plasmid) [Mycolicibacterium frederiksbergense]|uniref:Uncharacterized protein n=1 Tax=Mycolicibacterium frederiksbergense TaxID=117567 RepID=A0A6H0RY12_9MYCO|nr:hypothetical protein EXE63_02210 [Mycolicibacterium frederiksbergense]